MTIDPKVDAVIREMKYCFNYEIEKYDDDCNYILFKRTTEGRTHALVIEDHTFERSQRDFDPQKDTGDWLIFSMLLDDERGWFGNYVETQYPLTLGEYKLIERLIKAINESHVPTEEKEQNDIPVVTIPTPVTTWNSDAIPAGCRTCSNHPSNGGSGICHCIIGTQPIMCNSTATDICTAIEKDKMNVSDEIMSAIGGLRDKEVYNACCDNHIKIIHNMMAGVKSIDGQE